MVAMGVYNGAVLVLADSWTALGATPEQDTRIKEEGLTVVNAPRPLPAVWEVNGETRMGEAWQGEAAYGIFYAAGLPDFTCPAHFGEKLGDAWKSLDATPVRLVTKHEVEAMMRDEITRRGYDFDEYVDAFDGSLQALADYLGFPWE